MIRLWLIYIAIINIVIFHSYVGYVSLPEGMETPQLSSMICPIFVPIESFKIFQGG